MSKYKFALPVGKGTGLALCLLCLCSASPAGTLWESRDALYSLSIIGFYHIDAASNIVESVAVDTSGAKTLRTDQGFQEGRGAGQLSSRIGHRFSAFLETEITMAGNKSEITLERLTVRYDINNDSQFSLGRFHTTAGLWNRTYHHGRWLQISKDRPIQTDFGSVFLPKHIWGAMYDHRFAGDSRTVNLDLGVGSGRNHEFEDAVMGLAKSGRDLAFMAMINVVPTKQRGLSFGGSLWQSDLDLGGQSEVADEQILTAHIKFATKYGEFLTEFAMVEHGYTDRGIEAGCPDSSGTYKHDSFYLQYRHRLPVLERRLQPYFRVEELNLDECDTLYSALLTTRRDTLGLRYDLAGEGLADRGAFKLEFRRDNFKFPNRQRAVNSFHAQYSAYFD